MLSETTWWKLLTSCTFDSGKKSSFQASNEVVLELDNCWFLKFSGQNSLLGPKDK